MNVLSTIHQYIDRDTGAVVDERLVGDRLLVGAYALCSSLPGLRRALSSSRMTQVLALVAFRGPHASGALTPAPVRAEAAEVEWSRRWFERQIPYWECRPMPEADNAIVSPADARILVGSLDQSSPVFIKGAFFDADELLGADMPRWRDAFSGGSVALFRLTPDKYHYNHTPVSGEVKDLYTVEGRYHSCHPDVIVRLGSPYSRNRRVVTIIDTDVPGGTQVGLVAMLEVVAMMIGDIVQCYSPCRYENPQPVKPGMFVRKGRPKSLYRPGSSTDLLVFQKDRIDFAADLLANQARRDVASRFSLGFGRPLTETDVRVRSLIALGRPRDGDGSKKRR